MRAYVCAILALLGLAVGCKTGSSKHFAVYLTAECVVEPGRFHIAGGPFASPLNKNVTSTNDWTNVALIAPPVISEKDIVTVDFSNKLMKVKPAVFARLPNASVWGTQFILVVDGQRIFLGNFWTPLSSFSTTTPTLLPSPSPEWSSLFLSGLRTKDDPDPWSDPRVVQSLKKLHKLGHVEWPAIVEHVGSTNSQSR
jgi:hypothetical protein